MRKRSKSKKDKMNHKSKSEVANEFMRISKKVKVYLIEKSIKIKNDKGEDVDETLNQTTERLLGLNS